MKKKKFSIFAIALVLTIVSCLAYQVKAADPTTGSLTIICHEQKNGDETSNPVLSGVEYTLYKVDATCEDTDEAEYYVEYNSLEGVAKTTDSNGKIVYDNLELGRYYAVVTDIKDGAVYYENFLVDIPMTNTAGTGYDYDITVEPKIHTAYGNLELTKVDNAGKPIEGVTFKVQAMKGENFVPMSLDNVVTMKWTDYIPEGKTEVLKVTTDENGKIFLNNLPAVLPVENYHNYYNTVFYRLVEVSVPTGYIKNNIISNLIFYVDEYGKIVTNCTDSNSKMWGWTDGYDSEGNYDGNYLRTLSSYDKQFITNVTETDTLTSATYMNEKPTITKQVKNSNGTYVDAAGLNVKDTASYKITTDVPVGIFEMSTYKITDTIPDGLTLDRSSIKVQGTTATGIETIPEGLYTLSDTGLEITFDTSKMYDTTSTTKTPLYTSIIVTYDAKFNDNAVIGGNGNVNTASLTYTDNIGETYYDEENEKFVYPELSTNTITDTAEVHTGSLLIEKVQKGSTSTKLAGAKFKIATSEANAKAGTFVTDANGNDIEVETAETTGQATIRGLAYADDGSDTSYWLVETQAPTYKTTVDGEEVEKSYRLLSSPVEVKVGKTSATTATVVQNSKDLELPATGGIGLAIFAVVGITVMAVSVKMNKDNKVKEN